MMSRAVRVHRPDKIGMYSTIFNLSQCFPEILVSVIAEVRNTNTIICESYLQMAFIENVGSVE